MWAPLPGADPSRPPPGAPNRCGLFARCRLRRHRAYELGLAGKRSGTKRERRTKIFFERNYFQQIHQRNSITKSCALWNDDTSLHQYRANPSHKTAAETASVRRAPFKRHCRGAMPSLRPNNIILDTDSHKIFDFSRDSRPLSVGDGVRTSHRPVETDIGQSFACRRRIDTVFRPRTIDTPHGVSRANRVLTFASPLEHIEPGTMPFRTRVFALFAPDTRSGIRRFRHRTDTKRPMLAQVPGPECFHLGRTNIHDAKQEGREMTTTSRRLGVLGGLSRRSTIERMPSDDQPSRLEPNQ